MRRVKKMEMPIYLALLFAVIEESAGAEESLEKCCDLGSSWANQKLKCETFVGPVAGVPDRDQAACLDTVAICCRKVFKDLQCDEGKLDAKAGRECSLAKPSQKDIGDYRRDCCEGCKLGLKTASSGEACSFKKLSLGAPWDPAFMECCDDAKTTTTVSVKTTPSKNTLKTTAASETTDSLEDTNEVEDTESPKSADLCQLLKGLLCSDICVPTEGSYYCKCHEGSVLADDKRNCVSNATTEKSIDVTTSSESKDLKQTTPIISIQPMADVGSTKNWTVAPIKTKRTTRSLTGDDNELTPRCPKGYRYNGEYDVCDDIDECAEGIHNCGDDKCYNLPGGHQCASPLPPRRRTTPLSARAPLNGTKCAPGYRYSPSQSLCVDVDECAEQLNVCSMHEDCINLSGHYRCNCKPGFIRDNVTYVCVDMNECQMENKCTASQRCDNTIGSYTCVRILSCGTGYTLNAATEVCEDDDECFLGTHDCPPGYFCNNTLGSFRCQKAQNGNQKTSRKPFPTTRTTFTATTASRRSIFITPRTTPINSRFISTG